MRIFWIALLFLVCRVAAGEFVLLSDASQPRVEMRAGQGFIELRGEALSVNGGVRGTLKIGEDTFPIPKFQHRVLLPALEEGPFRVVLTMEYLTSSGRVRRTETMTREIDPGKKDLEINLDVPVDAPGKLTVVIDRPDGVRVRNLLSGAAAEAGNIRLVWNGRDDRGNLMEPGRYVLRTLTHPGLTADYQGSFANGGEAGFTPFGSNHSVMTALASAGGLIFCAAPLTEGGWHLVALTPEGKFVRGYPQLGGPGIDEVFVAADEKYIYLLNDGASLRERKNPAITLVRYERGGSFARNAPRYSVLYESPRAVDRARHGSHMPQKRNEFALRGAALCGGILYVANGETREVMAIEPESGNILRKYPIPEPFALAESGGRLLIASEKSVHELDPVSGAVRLLFQVSFNPAGIAANGDEIALSGAADHTVGIYRDGKLFRRIGLPGGAYAGEWLPERLVDPVGLAFDPGGTLWIAENRWNPKRITAWSPEGKLVYEKIGPPYYGSPGGGFDPQDGSVRVGQRLLWMNDAPRAVLSASGGHLNGKFAEALNYRFVRRDGRRFLVGQGKGVLISEFREDGSLRDLAWIGNVRQLHYALRHRKDTILDAEVKRRPDAAAIWIDANGNGDLDDAEFQFGPVGSRFGAFNWGTRVAGLEFRVTGRDEKGVDRLYNVTPAGYNRCGAPLFDLDAILRAGTLVESNGDPVIGETLNFDGGLTTVAAEPFMLGIDPAGRVLWRFPNRWVGVHGSQSAPLPRPGELQGVLFPLGTVPLPGGGEVGAWIGNHGRIFFLTDDGMYLDELFSDCRISELAGAGLIGGEPFGGVMEYDSSRNEVLLQAGNGGYRVYRIRGLDAIHRASRTFDVSAEQIRFAANQEIVPELPETCPTLRLGTSSEVSWGSGERRVRFRGAYDAESLTLEFRVDDPSPWKNVGRDWTQYFKSGDCADFQFDAGQGPRRLLFAPGGVVFYRFTGVESNAVDFASPWRSVRVPEVRLLDKVAPEVKVSTGGYTLKAVVPWKALETPPPVAGRVFSGDIGVIFGDREGTVNLSRQYYFNKNTGLVNDIPGEIEPPVKFWGKIQF